MNLPSDAHQAQHCDRSLTRRQLLTGIAAVAPPAIMLRAHYETGHPDRK